MIYNFAEVGPGLYRSGQPMSPDEWRWAYSQHGIRKELKLNDPTQGDFTTPKELGIETHSIHMPDNAEFPLSQLDWVDWLIDLHGKPETPLLVHCYGGKDRTGIVIARYRMRQCGWSKARALDEWIAFGSHRYAPLEQAWANWNP